MRFDLISKDSVISYFRNVAEMSVPKDDEYEKRLDFNDRAECEGLSPEDAYYLGVEHGETDMIRNVLDIMEIEYDKGEEKDK